MKHVSIFGSAILLMASCVRNPNSLDDEFGPVRIAQHLFKDYHVTAIDFDATGVAWIGTFKQGLIQYDGYTQTVYSQANSNLPDSLVMWDVTVDHNDHVWIGTNRGLVQFDGQEFNIFNTGNSPLAEDAVWSLAVDQGNTLWFASCRFQQGGLMTLNGADWTLYTPDNSSLPSHSVFDLAVDSRDQIWAVTGDGINNTSILKISGNAWTLYDSTDFGFKPYFFSHVTSDPNDRIYASIDYSLSSLWDCSRPNLIRFDGKDWSIVNPVNEKGESLGYVCSVKADLTGNVWATLGGETNLAILHHGKWNAYHVDAPISMISEIAFDGSNTAWLGTEDGIYRIKP